MRIWQFVVFIVGLALPAAVGDPTRKKNGIVDIPTNHWVDQTVEKLKGLLQSKGVTLFALIDHSGEAQKVGMKMLPTKLLIFGSPKGGTPLMLAAPSVAIDLPLKILVWDEGGQTALAYTAPAALAARYGLDDELAARLAAVEVLSEVAISG